MLEYGDVDVDDTKHRVRPIKSKRTLKNHKDVLLPFKIWLGDRRIDKYLISAYITEKRKSTYIRNGIEQPYSEATIYQLKSVLKKFAFWIDPEIGRAIRLTPIEKKNVQVLTPEDIEAMIEKGCMSRNNRDRALVAFMWESGCRKGELRNLKIKDVEEISDGNIGDNGVRVKVHGKTGVRPLKLISCYSYLRQWLEVHPRKGDPEAPLFCSTYPPYNCFSDSGIEEQLVQIALRAGFPPTRRIYPHLLRHSRATYLARFFTEAQMNVYFGWTQGSNQARTYVHLSGRDMEKAVDKLYGLSKDEKPENSILKCPNCKSTNNVAHARCFKCNYPLHEEIKRENDESATEALRQFLLLADQNPQLKTLLNTILTKS